MSIPSASDETKLISRSNDITGDSNFPQGCQISPDGLCVLTSTASDNLLRIYNIPTASDAGGSADADADADTSTPPRHPPTWTTSLAAREGDSIRSYCWYPLMNSYDPPTCAFLASSR